MKRKSLTDKLVKSLKPEAAEYMVTGNDGFYVRVLPSGVRTFWYRFTLGGKRHKMNLGQYPEVSLAEANDRHDRAKIQVRNGIDPRKPEEPEIAPIDETKNLTVAQLKEKWCGWSEKKHSAKWYNTLNLALEKDIIPDYGQRLASEIRRRDAIAILEQKAISAPGQAVNLHKALRGMFQYALEREMVEFNPFAVIRVDRVIPNMKQTIRERVLNDEEIKYLWMAIEQGGGSESAKRTLKLILTTGQRPGEVAGMNWSEIQIGVGNPHCLKCRRCGWWTIPKIRLKSKDNPVTTDHRVFLSPLSMSLINAAPENTSGFICPSDAFEEGRPIAVNSINHHVRRAVPSTGKIPYYGLPQWQPHDLRRTAATGWATLGAGETEVERILGHLPPVLVRTYNKFKYDNIKFQWLTAWGEYIQQLVD